MYHSTHVRALRVVPSVAGREAAWHRAPGPAPRACPTPPSLYVAVSAGPLSAGPCGWPEGEGRGGGEGGGGEGRGGEGRGGEGGRGGGGEGDEVHVYTYTCTCTCIHKTYLGQLHDGNLSLQSLYKCFSSCTETKCHLRSSQHVYTCTWDIMRTHVLCTCICIYGMLDYTGIEVCCAHTLLCTYSSLDYTEI